MPNFLITATAAAAVAFTGAATATTTTAGDLVPIPSLNQADTLNLLKSWDVPSIVKGCRDAANNANAVETSATGGCTGKLLVGLVDSMGFTTADNTAALDSSTHHHHDDDSVDTDHGDHVEVFADHLLSAAPAKELLSLARKVAAATAAGGVDQTLLLAPKARRRLAATEMTGIAIKGDDSAIYLGKNADVVMHRSGTGELTLSNDVVVNNTLTVNGDISVSGGTTIAGHLEVDNTISTGFGRITRDFHQYYTTRSNAGYYQMKTNIKQGANTMFRLEILGYSYGTSKSIDSVTTGYTYHLWTCINNEANINYGDGLINTYCSDDGYVVLELYLSNTYFMGITVSGWFLNPNGNAHDIEVLEDYMDTATGYYAGRRQLEEGQEEDAVKRADARGDDSNADAAAATVDDNGEPAANPVPVPVPVDGDGNTRREHSFYALLDEVAEMREEMAALKARVAELEQTR